MHLSNERLEKIKGHMKCCIGDVDGCMHKPSLEEIVEMARELLERRNADRQRDIHTSWVCNECGAEEYADSISEDDIENLACGRCGSNEFHREPVVPAPPTR